MTPNISPPSRERIRKDVNARRLRKRETDRLAQRANRERTKHRIELLEEEIKRLKSRDQNAVLAALLEANENQRKRNDELQAALLKISLTIKAVCKNDSAIPFPDHDGELAPSGQESLSDDAHPPSGSEYDASTANCGVEVGFSCQTAVDADPTSIGTGLITDHSQENPCSYFNTCVDRAMGGKQTPPSAPPDDNPDQTIFPASSKNTATHLVPLGTGLSTEGFSEGFNLYPQSPSVNQQLVFPGPYCGLSFYTLAADEEKWDISNDAFTRALQSAALLPGPDQVDPNVPFKAILSGWHTIDAYEREKPIWNMLRLIDERVFGLWTSKIQKVALMYVTHMLVKYRMHPTPENLQRVPTWLRSRPSQERMPHPLVIDLLLWPGLRDRLVFDHPKYTKTGEFSSFYCNHLHFYWPFPADAIGTYNPYANRFQVSQKFREYVLDLRNWTMDSHFLTRYPELKDDITAYEDRMSHPC